MVTRGGIEPPTQGFSVPCSKTLFLTKIINLHLVIKHR